MNKWDIISIFKAEEFQCKNCGVEKDDTFSTIWHYRGFIQLDGVCTRCVREDFNVEVWNKYMSLLDLYWLWFKYKRDNDLVLQNFTLDLLKFLIKEHKNKKEWKAHYEKMLLDEYNFNVFYNTDETDYVIKTFFIPYLKFQRMLGEW